MKTDDVTATRKWIYNHIMEKKGLLVGKKKNVNREENKKKKHMDNKEIANHTDDEHVIKFADDSIEIKDTKESKKDNVPTNDKEINHKRKTDMIPNIEPSNRVKEEQPLILKHLDNELEGDIKDVTESVFPLTPVLEVTYKLQLL